MLEYDGPFLLHVSVEKEENIFQIHEYKENEFSGNLSFIIEKQFVNSYFRAEIQSEGPKGLHFSFSG